MKFSKGQIPWNKGLTKNIDSRVIPKCHKICEKCQNEFIASCGTQKCCSECRKNYCEQCGKSIGLYKRFCNNSCSGKWKIKNTNAKNWLKTGNKRKSNETKRKMRVAALNYIEKIRGNISPNIGRNEIQLLNLQEQKDKCKILRQYRIKNLGYIVDGYCPETNTVYEVYEKAHENKIDHDFNRQKQIENFLNCKFEIIKCS
jgi:very-short-patch-repair endonuclease